MTQASSSSSAVTLSIRVSPDVRNQLEELANATGRSKSFLAAEAIEGYLMAQLWQIQAIEGTIKKVDEPHARFIEHSKVANWLNSWGTEEEKEPPR